MHRMNDIRATIVAAQKRCDAAAEHVHVVAVTKYVDTSTTEQVLDAGIEHIGENRVEEGVDKWEALGSRGTWHFIGNLQSKKVKQMIDKFQYIHSLDRLSLAKEINKRAPEDKRIKCFVQVNVSGEGSKSGLSPEETIEFIEKLGSYPSIEVVGLMTMAPFVEDPETVRPYFRRLRELRDDIVSKEWTHAPCHELSMGMSNDYVVAVEEGATYIRVGSALVGKN
ncbi:YggS family pyridoxal phosphate-dependent enzyme [Bacillus alkalicola]|uniref:Pyridoxal phosphate homeostasis protein n=2 Tax=Bacillales TaxID=1385 RepID=A0ABS6JPD5_9BACI|nr:YggS family pyridoxal phosphate-dependent enzyme [Bacillus alkalicola]MBU9720429.1 YggS family pyridoxal phosphate-dependent enzyme [Bacillus alkalicola]